MIVVNSKRKTSIINARRTHIGCGCGKNFDSEGLSILFYKNIRSWEAQDLFNELHDIREQILDGNLFDFDDPDLYARESQYSDETIEDVRSFWQMATFPHPAMRTVSIQIIFFTRRIKK